MTETEAQRIAGIKRRNRAMYEPIPPIPAPTPPTPAKAKPTAGDRKEARQAATPAKAPTFTTAEKIAALRQQDPGLSFEEAARKVSATDPAQYQAEMGTAPVPADSVLSTLTEQAQYQAEMGTAPVAATPAATTPAPPEPAPFDPVKLARAIQAEEPGISLPAALLRVRDAHPGEYARFTRGES